MFRNSELLGRFKTPPERLTNEIIHQIGSIYLERHGKKPQSSCCCFFFHTHHPIAKKLTHYKSNTPRERWYFLADTYGELNSNSGDLAKTIRKLFTSVFVRKINTWRDGDPLATYEISSHMNDILNKYYLREADIELEELRDKSKTTSENTPLLSSCLYGKYGMDQTK